MLVYFVFLICSMIPCIATNYATTEDFTLDPPEEATARAVRDPTESIKTPCDLPQAGDSDFRYICSTDYLGKRYVCDPDQILTATEIDRIHGDILRPARYYYYCYSCRGKPEKCIDDNNFIGTFNDHFLIQKHIRSKRGLYFGNASAMHAHDEDSVTLTPAEEYYEKYVKKKKHLSPLRIAINIFAKLVYPHTWDLAKSYLPCATSLMNLSTTKGKDIFNESEIVTIYSMLSEERWRSHSCSPNVTILVFAGDTIEYTANGDRLESHRRPRLYVRHTFSQHDLRMYHWLTERTSELVIELNNDSTLITGPQKLYKFLQQFTALYDEANSKRWHTIPTWAAITFGVCSVLSVCAVLVGNLVTSADRRGSRKSKNSNKGSGNRKWRAGFSGGMWASV